MAATSSRRLRRQATDDIEEAASSQARIDEDVEEEEAPPSRPAKKGKRHASPIEETEGVDVQPVNGVDPLADFVDQPVDSRQATRINGLATDWDTVRQTCHQPSYNLVKDIASVMAEFVDGDKGVKNIISIDKLMRGLIDTEVEFATHNKILQELHQQAVRGEPVSEIISKYDEGVQQQITAYQNKTSRQKYAKRQMYSDFRQAIHEVQHPGEAMPPVVDLIPREEGDDSDDDDDVQVGGVTQDYKCPLTLTPLTNPLTSVTCGHSFDADAIKEFLGHPSARKECPNAGCKKIISLKDLNPNKDLSRRAKEAARRERMREEEDESDDDNVIE